MVLREIRRIFSFIISILFCTDEEDVFDETRKHKNHYFPSTRKDQVKKPTNNGDNADKATYNSQNPVNFLFSNGADSSGDDKSNDEA